MSKIVSVSLPPETRDALDAEAKRQRRSRSWVVREAVAEYVAQRRDAAGELAAGLVAVAGVVMLLAVLLGPSEE